MHSFCSSLSRQHLEGAAGSGARDEEKGEVDNTREDGAFREAQHVAFQLRQKKIKKIKTLERDKSIRHYESIMNSACA